MLSLARRIRGALTIVPSLAALAALGCRDAPTTPAGPAERAELLGARVPATAAAGTAFEVVGYFGRGACDQATPVVEQTADGVRLALELRAPRSGRPCILILLRDSVVARVGPAAPRPFTVRLRRPDAPDSVVVVRAP